MVELLQAFTINQPAVCFSLRTLPFQFYVSFFHCHFFCPSHISFLHFSNYLTCDSAPKFFANPLEIFLAPPGEPCKSCCHFKIPDPRFPDSKTTQEGTILGTFFLRVDFHGLSLIQLRSIFIPYLLISLKFRPRCATLASKGSISNSKIQTFPPKLSYDLYDSYDLYLCYDI